MARFDSESLEQASAAEIDVVIAAALPELDPKIKGTWKLIAQVREFAEFDPTAKRRHVRNPPFPTISLEDGGKTSSPLWAWSGDTLMNLDRYEALKMRVRTIGDEEFLLMESGGFNTRHKPDWKSRWYVLERETTKR